MTVPDRYTCEEVFRRLADYLDHALSPEELRLVREHLEICSMCASEYLFESSLMDGIRAKVQQAGMPVDLLQRVTSLLRKDEAGEE